MATSFDYAMTHQPIAELNSILDYTDSASDDSDENLHVDTLKEIIRQKSN